GSPAWIDQSETRLLEAKLSPSRRITDFPYRQDTMLGFY
ncbi:MAG: hypothetical protein ACI9UU_003406, partial [Candidatus Azotimanducaceae bacterium]